jgi:hypothetical protein
MHQTADLDGQVRRHVYDVTMHRGHPPTLAETSSALGLTIEDTRAAFERLASGHVLVLQPGTGEILMAAPFSAVPTPFLVELPSFSCFGNCIWDALGIPVMLKVNGRIKTACGDCGKALEITVAGGKAYGDGSVIHFAIPAHHWWDDIVFN